MDFKQYKSIVYNTISAAMEVHSELKWGLLEPVYNETMHLELMERGIAHEVLKSLPCYYKHHKMQKHYQMDIVVENDVIVELKSAAKLIPAHRTQLFNYMRITRKPIGLLINFGQSRLQGERYGLNQTTNECVLLDKNMSIVEVMDENNEDNDNQK